MFNARQHRMIKGPCRLRMSIPDESKFFDPGGKRDLFVLLVDGGEGVFEFGNLLTFTLRLLLVVSSFPPESGTY